MSEKGLTLKKLLMIIFIIVLIVLGVFYFKNASKKTKETAFVNDVQNLIKFARENFTSSLLLEKEKSCFHSETNPIKVVLADTSLKYYVKLNEQGEVTNIVVTSDIFEFTANGDKINELDVGSRSSNRKYKVSELKDDTIIPSCQ